MKGILKYQKIVPFLSARSYSINNYYDICIVGGGPVGFGFASLLSSYPNLKSSKILLLESEKSKPFVPQETFSNRTVALSPKTKEILEGCNAWKLINDHRYNPVNNMFVWEQSSNSFITFRNDDSPHDHHNHLAYIVENDLLQHAITSSLKDSSNVEVRYEARVSGIDFKISDVATVTMVDGSRVCASLLVGADGYRSRVRASSGIKSVEKHYDQKAIVCVIGFDAEHNDSGVAWQRFSIHGPIAYLPLDKSHASLIWSTTTAEADRLQRLDERAFLDELNHEMFTDIHHNNCVRQAEEAFGRLTSSFEGSHERLEPAKAVLIASPRASFPLGFLHATNYVSGSVALIGDAAHRVLPLAGQGVNLGFGDAAALARVVSEGVALGETIGEHSCSQ